MWRKSSRQTVKDRSLCTGNDGAKNCCHDNGYDDLCVCTKKHEGKVS